jgi:uncharacterized protein
MGHGFNEYPPIPVKRPLLLQNWKYLTFLHWPYSPSHIAPLLPNGLDLDTFGGAAWISLTPFIVEGLRIPFLPALPWISRFPETNVRTYVRGPHGEPGIWFFTLEADRVLAVIGARLAYGLPYRWADMQVNAGKTAVDYRSVRHLHGHSGPARVQVSLRIGDSLKPTDLDLFLTARFRLYTVLAGRLAFAQVEHEPWPLRTGQIMSLKQDIITGSGLPETVDQPLVHYSPGVHVRVAAPKLIARIV